MVRADEPGQVVDFLVNNDHRTLSTTLFPYATLFRSDLSYATAPDANGSATVSVKIHDNRAAAHTSDDNTAAQTVTLTITAVNDQPTLIAITDKTVNEDEAVQTVPLSGIGSGAATESQ